MKVGDPRSVSGQCQDRGEVKGALRGDRGNESKGGTEEDDEDAEAWPAKARRRRVDVLSWTRMVVSEWTGITRFRQSRMRGHDARAR